MKEGRAYNQKWMQNDGMDQYKKDYEKWSQNELRLANETNKGFKTYFRVRRCQQK